MRPAKFYSARRWRRHRVLLRCVFPVLVAGLVQGCGGGGGDSAPASAGQSQSPPGAQSGASAAAINVTQVQAAGVVSDPGSEVRLDGAILPVDPASGQFVLPIPVAAGSKTLLLSATNKDGTATKTITIQVE